MIKVLYLFDIENKTIVLSENIEVTSCTDIKLCYELLYKDIFDLLIIDGSKSTISSYNAIKSIHKLFPISIWFISRSLDAVTYISYLNIGVSFILPCFQNSSILHKALTNYFENLIPTKSLAYNTGNIISYDNLLINVKTHSLSCAGGPNIKLQQKQFDILMYLIKNAGCLVTYQDLWTNCWNETFDANLKKFNLNTLHNHIFRLRSALSKSSYKNIHAENYISTVNNQGYQILLHVEPNLF